MVKKKQVETKKPKDLKKEIEDKTFGMKNKKKSREVKKAIERINVQPKVNKKQEEEITLVQPRAPIGVDPKTIPCVYYLNKLCTKGDKCKYGHEKKKQEVVDDKKEEAPKSKLVCRFLIDAINNNELMTNWKCPDPSCKDIHKLTEVGDVEISLEEFIELKRQSVDVNYKTLTEETFNEWKIKKKKEEEVHKKKIEAMKKGTSGMDLFKERPDIFVDDEEVTEVNYNERCEEDEELIEGIKNIEL